MLDSPADTNLSEAHTPIEVQSFFVDQARMDINFPQSENIPQTKITNRFENASSSIDIFAASQNNFVIQNSTINIYRPAQSRTSHFPESGTLHLQST